MKMIITDNESVDTWECRYFVRETPEAFLPHRLASTFPAVRDSSKEKDVYLCTSRSQGNVKLREKGKVQTLKLKVRLRDNGDGFELWKTAIDSSLPASNEDWHRIAAELNISPFDDLSGLRKIEEVLAMLTSRRPDVKYIHVPKSRRIYWRGPAKLEVADVALRSRPMVSIAFEAAILSEAQRLHKELSGDTLGKPKNFVMACLEALGMF